ncbi:MULTISPECIES: hypothetical protein [unclassified Virgibacillus]|uniref:hypothetical protein n=1 Tax=unclassified Virgibacillus TaxID=2620237 RepID=UPI00090CCE14|nr:MULTISPECIES: hypothetical protein [unclassified Virgibacillus]API93483.1 hypothetical protein BKP57_17715 [Virgibacillus sp. 6R]MBS7430130.1 hypothetical protein [Virgibacillus sp. 19R1-5]
MFQIWNNRLKEEKLAERRGGWTDWLREIEMDRSDANKFIRIVDELSDVSVGTYPRLGMKALYMITTLPESERTTTHITSRKTRTSSQLQLNRQKRPRGRNYDCPNFRWTKQVITERTVITMANSDTYYNLGGGDVCPQQVSRLIQQL